MSSYAHALLITCLYTCDLPLDAIFLVLLSHIRRRLSGSRYPGGRLLCTATVARTLDRCMARAPDDCGRPWGSNITHSLPGVAKEGFGAFS